ncbi:MAG: DUF4034 domain-containing protein [Alphaproteobacteria bacterium]
MLKRLYGFSFLYFLIASGILYGVWSFSPPKKEEERRGFLHYEREPLSGLEQGVAQAFGPEMPPDLNAPVSPKLSVVSADIPFRQWLEELDLSEIQNLRRWISEGKYENIDSYLTQHYRAFEQYQRSDQDTANLLDTISILPDAPVYAARWAEKMPASPWPWIYLCNHYVDAAFYYRGTAYINKTPERRIKAMGEASEKAFSSCGKAAKISPENILVHSFLVRMLKASGSEDLKLSIVNGGLKIRPCSEILRGSYFGGILPQWGGTYEQVSEFRSDTMGYVEKCPWLKKYDGARDFWLAVAYDLQKKDEKAMQYYQDAAARGSHGATDELARRLHNDKHYDEAAELYYKNLKNAGAYDSSSYYEISRTLSAGSRRDESDRALDVALYLYPYDPDYLRVKATNLWNKKKFPEVEKTYEAAMYYGRYDEYVLADYSDYLLTIKKDYPRAEKILAQLNSLYPDKPNYIAKYAESFFRQRKCEAMGALKEYLRVCKSDAEGCSQEGVVYSRRTLAVLQGKECRSWKGKGLGE